MANTRMSIVIDDSLKALIQERAKINNRSTSGEISQAIKQYLAGNSMANSVQIVMPEVPTQTKEESRKVEKSNVKASKFAFK